MPIDADNLTKIPPTVRREFDVTDPVCVDTLAFFAEHPNAAYSIDEIQQLARVCSDAYPQIPTGQRSLGEFQYQLKSCATMGLLGTVSDKEYYYLSETDAANTLLEIAGWCDVRDVEEISHGRGLEDVTLSEYALSEG